MCAKYTLHTAAGPKIWIENQDSAGRKKSTVLHSIIKKSNEVGQLFSLEEASNIPKKEFLIPKIISDRKKGKLWNILSEPPSF